MFKISSDPVTWRGQKQSNVSIFTTESDFIAALKDVKETVWLHQLLQDVSESKICEKGTTFFTDNQSAIELIKKHSVSHLYKHINVPHNFIREKCDDRSVIVKYVKSEEQLNDIFTKVLPNVKVKN